MNMLIMHYRHDVLSKMSVQLHQVKCEHAAAEILVRFDEYDEMGKSTSGA